MLSASWQQNDHIPFSWLLGTIFMENQNPIKPPLFSFLANKKIKKKKAKPKLFLLLKLSGETFD
jgi:hypothetical protein